MEIIIAYIRSTGFVSLLIGGASMMQQPEYYWLAVSLVYIGLTALALDAFFEKWRKVWMRWLAITAVILIILAFSWIWVFVEAPIDVVAMAINAEYPPDYSVGGIKWRPEFTELNVEVHNPTSRSYYDLDLLVRTNMPIVAITQTSDLSDVLIESFHGPSLRQILVSGSTGSKKANPLVLVATDAGYKVYCGKLPGHKTLKLVVAIADIRWNPSPPQPQRYDFGIFEKDYILRLQSDVENGGKWTYWYGHPDGNPFTPRPAVDHVKISGDYVAAQKKRTIERNITIGKVSNQKKRLLWLFRLLFFLRLWLRIHQDGNGLFKRQRMERNRFRLRHDTSMGSFSCTFLGSYFI
jgi:hypothetical protein